MSSKHHDMDARKAMSKSQRHAKKQAKRLGKKTRNSFNALAVGIVMVLSNFLGGLDVSVVIPEVDLGPVVVGPITISTGDD